MDVEPYLENLRRRGRVAREARANRAQTIRRRLADAVRVLSDEHCVESVWVFGSLVGGELYERSDVDIAVEGLDPEQYWRALDRIIAILGVPVDLVPLEEASDSLRARIFAEGERLHG